MKYNKTYTKQFVFPAIKSSLNRAKHFYYIFHFLRTQYAVKSEISRYGIALPPNQSENYHKHF